VRTVRVIVAVLSAAEGVVCLVEMMV
jgi:hypothetical protein